MDKILTKEFTSLFLFFSPRLSRAYIGARWGTDLQRVRDPLVVPSALDPATTSSANKQQQQPNGDPVNKTPDNNTLAFNFVHHEGVNIDDEVWSL